MSLIATLQNPLLQFIIKNNVSFSLIGQPETKALFKFLNPRTKQISRRTLGRELESKFDVAKTAKAHELHKHMESGGRIALTTNAWAGNNKLDYSTVTAHWRDTDGVNHSTVLDIIELRNPVHNGLYLCKKLLQVTNRFGINPAIISITRDNAARNDIMLKEFEALVAEQFAAMDEVDQLKYCLKFNLAEGDVRCCAHIYNIGVQAGKL